MFISVSDSSINLSLDPTINNGYATTTLKVNVGTNNPTGYHLFLNADGSNNALINTSNNTVTINALPNNNTNNTGYNESNFPSNTWGYNSNGSSWSFVGSANYFPLSNTATEIDSSTTNTNNKETTISLAAKVDYAKPSGSYTKDLIISILPTISTYELNYNANTTETVTNLPLPLVMNHWANIAPAIPINTASIPSRDGYNFKGYTTIQNGDTAEYVYDESTNTFSPATFTPASVTALSDTLYAVWEKRIVLINFTIDGEPYQAEEGMTWKDWMSSNYNTDQKFHAICRSPFGSNCGDDWSMGDDRGGIGYGSGSSINSSFFGTKTYNDLVIFMYQTPSNSNLTFVVETERAKGDALVQNIYDTSLQVITSKDYITTTIVGSGVPSPE